MTNETMARTEQTARKQPSEEAMATLTSTETNPNDQMQPSKAQQNKT